jgi:hypothetical protein
MTNDFAVFNDFAAERPSMTRLRRMASHADAAGVISSFRHF